MVLLNNLRCIKWDKKNPPLTKEGEKILEAALPYKLPRSFVSFLQVSDGGLLENSFYVHNNLLQKRILLGITVIFGVSYKDYNIIKECYIKPEYFPLNLISFALTADDNYLCFDYREEVLRDDPPVVYWSHESAIGNDIFYVAENFIEFLKILRPAETSP